MPDAIKNLGGIVLDKSDDDFPEQSAVDDGGVWLGDTQPVSDQRLSLDPYEIRKELLGDREFMGRLREREAFRRRNVNPNPLVPFGGPKDPDETWRGTEQQYLPKAEEPKDSGEGDPLQLMVIEEIRRRQGVREFRNKYGRNPTARERQALEAAMRKYPLKDYGEWWDPKWGWELFIDAGAKKI